MPHDAKGNVLEVGDDVIIKGKVKHVGTDPANANFCNLDVELAERMPAYPDSPHVVSALNTRMVEKAGRGIGWAVGEMRAGRKVRRAGWNGKGMFVVLMPELKLPPFSTQEPGPRVNDRTAKHIGVDTPLDSQPYIAMWTAQQKWQPGWLCSQADLLAQDWEAAD